MLMNNNLILREEESNHLSLWTSLLAVPTENTKYPFSINNTNETVDMYTFDHVDPINDVVWSEDGSKDDVIRSLSWWGVKEDDYLRQEMKSYRGKLRLQQEFNNRKSQEIPQREGLTQKMNDNSKFMLSHTHQSNESFPTMSKYVGKDIDTHKSNNTQSHSHREDNRSNHKNIKKSSTYQGNYKTYEKKDHHIDKVYDKRNFDDEKFAKYSFNEDRRRVSEYDSKDNKRLISSSSNPKTTFRDNSRERSRDLIRDNSRDRGDKYSDKRNFPLTDNLKRARSRSPKTDRGFNERHTGSRDIRDDRKSRENSRDRYREKRDWRDRREN